MAKKECEHEWHFTVPYRPSDSDGFIHVEVEACCYKCGEERSSDYSWYIDDHHTVNEEGDYEAYECDRCEVEMDNEGEFTEFEDMHFCSKKCYAEYWGEEE